MIRRVPWSSRVATALLLLSMLAGPLTLSHADGADDVACAPVAVSHDESAHAFRPEGKSAAHEGQHCFLCHTLRSFHAASERFEQHHAAQGAERLHASAVDAVAHTAWARVSGRAPPQ